MGKVDNLVMDTPLRWSRFGCTSYLGVKNKYGYQGLS